MKDLKPRKKIGGFTMMDLLVAMGITAGMCAVALPHLDTRRQDINTFAKTLTADLRLARSLAIVGGVHYRLEKNAVGYEIQRLREEVTGNWTVEGVQKTVEHPTEVSWYMWPTHFEFNTRGLQIATGDSPVHVEIWDTFGGTQTVSVWPSGQAYAGR